MPNDYLVACHRYITRELDRAETQRRQSESCGDALQAAYHAGQIEEFYALRRYISDRFNLTTQRYY
jgi:hypothetical protein